MKNIIIIFLLLFPIFNQLNGQQIKKQKKNLYPIIENGFWGYIDNTGKVVIKPQFRSAGKFSEGLAPVRLDGTYGFIDRTGKYIIQPQFDIAYTFKNEQPKVFINSKPYYIDKKGRKIFEHDFSEISGFDENNLSIVITKSENYGVINRQGYLIIDTIYRKISPFSDGLAIVTGHNHKIVIKSGEETINEIGVVNTKGKFVVQFGEYKDISEYWNGFAKVKLNVEPQSGYYVNEGIIDNKGKLRFKEPAKKWTLHYSNNIFSEDIATISIYKKDPDSIKVWSTNLRHDYKGAINTDGEILFSNREWDEITCFKNNRAFVKDIFDEWYLIDKGGNILNKDPYKEILYHTYQENPDYLFQDGIQYVKTDKGWSAIDTSSKFVTKPEDFDFRSSSMYRRGDIIFTKEDISIESDRYSYRYGFINIKTKTIVAPQFHDIQFKEFEDDLIYVMEDGLIGYVNQQGKYVWREKKVTEQKLTHLNIDFMNRGYFYANSPYKEDLAGLGGWGGSGNVFKEITKISKYKQDTLSIKIQPNENATYRETYNGMKLYISNTSQDTIFFDAQDSRLYMKIQAQDENGQWKDIEYLPSSWCGNSYHSLFLPPTHYWEFVIPKYEGEIKTQLRAELLYKSSINQKEDFILYSNEFQGSVNPGQFWRKKTYHPSGLMDPYID